MKSNLRRWKAILCTVLFAAAGANAADILWMGGTGNWDIDANWSPAQVPGPADNVFITSDGTYTVTIDKPDVDPTVIGSLTLGGAGGTQTLSVGNVVLTLNGESVVNANGHLDLTLNSSELVGPGTVTVDGTLNWVNGTVGGPGVTSIGSDGVMNITGNATLLTRALNNGGTVNWDSGNLDIDTGAVITNLAGGVFNIGFDGSANTGGIGGGVFDNAGILQKTAGAASARLTLQVNNAGMVEVQSGTLSLDDGGTHTGTFNIAGGAVAQFGGGNHVLAPGSVVTGAGVMSLSGGVLNFNSAGTLAVVNLTGGTLGGTSPVTVTGPLTLAGGTITNALVTASGGLTIIGNTTLSGGKLINPSNALWSAGNLTGANGAVLSNLSGATFTTTFDGNLATAGGGVPPTFVNDGLFQKTGGSALLGKTDIDFQFINTGIVEVQTNTVRYAVNRQTDGLTLLNGGGLEAQDQPLQFLGGTLMGTGFVTMANTQNLTNSATIDPGLPLGQLDIVGNLRQTPSGVLNIELGGYLPGTDFDRVTVTGGGGGGVATLGGTLNVTLTNGFSPTNGATFTFLTAVSRAGAFATFNYPSNDIGMQVSYDLTSAKVTVSNLKPVVANPISNTAPVTYGSVFDFQFPANTFSDPDNDTLTYTASGMPAGLSFTGATRTFSGAPTQVGVFPVAVAATDSGTPSLSVTNTFTITVNPADITGSFTAADKVYDGTTSATVLTRTLNGVLAGDAANVSLTGGTATFATATAGPGKTVTLTGAALTGSAAGNYNLTSVGTTTAAITALDITGSFTASDKVYDGSADATVLTRTLNGVLAADTANVSLTGGTATFATATAGAGKTVTLTGATLTGSAAGNYNLTSVGTTTAAITALDITGSFTAGDKVYDGSANATVLTRTLTGVLAADAANVSLTGGTASFANATVGAGKTVTLTGATLTGSAAGNYNLTSVGTATAAITALDITGSFTAGDKVYDGSADATVLTRTLTGVLAADAANVSLTGGTATFATATAGAGKTVTLTGATLTGSAAGNYNLTSVGTTTAAITALDITGSFTAADKVYDGSTNATVLTRTLNGVLAADTANVSLTGGTASFASATAGPGKTVTLTGAALTGSAAGNYNLTSVGTTTAAITAPAPLLLPLTIAGTTDVVISWSAVSNGLYRVQYKSDLNTTNWTDFIGDVVASGSLASKTNTVTTTNRFYRVQVLP